MTNVRFIASSFSRELILECARLTRIGRSPTLVMFVHSDYFLFTGASNCASPSITVPTTPPTSTLAWNHGGLQPEIATTWLGLVGPGDPFKEHEAATVILEAENVLSLLHQAAQP